MKVPPEQLERWRQNAAYGETPREGYFYAFCQLVEALAEARGVPAADEHYVLILSDMCAPKFENSNTTCAWARTPELLKRFLEEERVERYKDDRWSKSFRRGGPLEWSNPYAAGVSYDVEGSIFVGPKGLGPPPGVTEITEEYLETLKTEREAQAASSGS